MKLQLEQIVKEFIDQMNNTNQPQEYQASITGQHIKIMQRPKTGSDQFKTQHARFWGYVPLDFDDVIAQSQLHLEPHQYQSLNRFMRQLKKYRQQQERTFHAKTQINDRPEPGQ